MDYEVVGSIRLDHIEEEIAVKVTSVTDSVHDCGSGQLEANFNALKGRVNAVTVEEDGKLTVKRPKIQKRDSDSSDLCDWLSLGGSSFGSASLIGTTKEINGGGNSSGRGSGSSKVKGPSSGGRNSSGGVSGPTRTASRRQTQLLKEVQLMEECCSKALHCLEMAEKDFRSLNVTATSAIAASITKRLEPKTARMVLDEASSLYSGTCDDNVSSRANGCIAGPPLVH